MRRVRLVAKILSPLMYGAAVVHVVIGGAVYGPWSWLRLLLERQQRPTLPDQARICALLIPSVVLLSPLVVAFGPVDDPGGGGVIATIAVTAAGCALVATLVLFARRLRFDHVSFDGAA